MSFLHTCTSSQRIKAAVRFQNTHRQTVPKSIPKQVCVIKRYLPPICPLFFVPLTGFSSSGFWCRNLCATRSSFSRQQSAAKIDTCDQSTSEICDKKNKSVWKKKKKKREGNEQGRCSVWEKSESVYEESCKCFASLGGYVICSLYQRLKQNWRQRIEKGWRRDKIQ